MYFLHNRNNNKINHVLFCSTCNYHMNTNEKRKSQQEALARESAERSSQNTIDGMTSADETKQLRLQNAEQSMTKMLQNVNRETENVEAAMAALKDANQSIENDPFYRLKQRGGIPKQLALVGFVLFSFRSITDTIAAVSTIATTIPDDGNPMTLALVQGGIAIACAAAYFLL
jgi:hypothetical protein